MQPGSSSCWYTWRPVGALASRLLAARAIGHPGRFSGPARARHLFATANSTPAPRCVPHTPKSLRLPDAVQLSLFGGKENNGVPLAL